MKTVFALIEGVPWRVARITAQKKRPVAVVFQKLSGEFPTERIEETLAERAIAELKTLGHAGEPICLALQSASCFAAYVVSPSARQTLSQEGWQYLLEEPLPFSAEELTADFLKGREGALGIAVLSAAWEPLLAQLESRSVFVPVICPWAVLACQGIPPLAETELLLWETPATRELFECHQGTLQGWTTLLTGRDESWQIEAMTAERDHPPVIEQRDGDSLDEAAAGMLVRLLNGKSSPWINLRRGHLADPRPYRAIRGSRNLALTMLCLLFYSVAAGWQWRAWQAEEAAQIYQRAEQQLFQQVLPGQSVPSAVRSRLESELNRLKLSVKEPPPDVLPVSIVPKFANLLNALPDQRGYRISQMLFEGDSLTLTGEALNTKLADQIRASLVEAGFEVGLPSVSRQGDRVNFELSAQVTEASHP